MSKSISNDGTSIAFEKSGKGPAVILVDGALCYRRLGPMGPIARELSSDFTYSLTIGAAGERAETLRRIQSNGKSTILKR